MKISQKVFLKENNKLKEVTISGIYKGKVIAVKDNTGQTIEVIQQKIKKRTILNRLIRFTQAQRCR